MEHSKCCGWILPVLILVFTIWPQGSWSKWVVIVAAAFLLVHSFGLCGSSCEVPKTKVKKKKK